MHFIMFYFIVLYFLYYIWYFVCSSICVVLILWNFFPLSFIRDRGLPKEHVYFKGKGTVHISCSYNFHLISDNCLQWDLLEMTIVYIKLINCVVYNISFIGSDIFKFSVDSHPFISSRNIQFCLKNQKLTSVSWRNSLSHWSFIFQPAIKNTNDQ